MKSNINIKLLLTHLKVFTKHNHTITPLAHNHKPNNTIEYVQSHNSRVTQKQPRTYQHVHLKTTQHDAYSIVHIWKSLISVRFVVHEKPKSRTTNIYTPKTPHHTQSHKFHTDTQSQLKRNIHYTMPMCTAHMHSIYAYIQEADDDDDGTHKHTRARHLNASDWVGGWMGNLFDHLHTGFATLVTYINIHHTYIIHSTHTHTHEYTHKDTQAHHKSNKICCFM